MSEVIPCEGLTKYSYELNFCCNFGSNRKIQPYYWLTTDPTTKTKQRKTEREKNKERLRTSGLT